MPHGFVSHNAVITHVANGRFSELELRTVRKREGERVKGRGCRPFLAGTDADTLRAACSRELINIDEQ